MGPQWQMPCAPSPPVKLRWGSRAAGCSAYIALQMSRAIYNVHIRHVKALVMEGDAHVLLDLRHLRLIFVIAPPRWLQACVSELPRDRRKTACLLENTR